MNLSRSILNLNSIFMPSTRDVVAWIFVDVDQRSSRFSTFLSSDGDRFLIGLFVSTSSISSFFHRLFKTNYRPISISILFLYVFNKSTNAFSDFHQSILRHWSILSFSLFSHARPFTLDLEFWFSVYILWCKHLGKLSIQLSLTWRIIRSSILFSYLPRRMFANLSLNFDSRFFLSSTCKHSLACR